jgi:hypothetical protein
LFIVWTVDIPRQTKLRFKPCALPEKYIRGKDLKEVSHKKELRELAKNNHPSP